MQGKILIAMSAVMGAALALSAQQTIPQQGLDLNPSSNLPSQRVGPEDLLALQVYDAPELTRTVRVSAEGTIRLPMLKEPVRVQGLFPNEIEVLLAQALERDKVYIEPFVTVNVAEYHSRPISVTGAVKAPVIFQAIGTVRLLDALARAGGITPETAGSEIIVTRPNGDAGPPSIQRVLIKALVSGSDPELNIKLMGGEEVRVPDIGKIIVSGNVGKPGVYPVLDPSDTNTVRTAIAQAQGLAQFYSHTAYIYRTDDKGSTHEIVVDLAKILQRKSPDVVLQARDLLYVPDSSGRRITQTTIQAITGLSSSAATALIYTTR
jgi:polysaccharide export outer membrane protein